MSSVQIDKWVTLDLVVQTGGGFAETVFNYNATVMPIPEGDLFAFAVAWRTIMTTFLTSALTVGDRLDRVEVKTHNATTYNTEAISYFPSGTYGTWGSAPSPNNVAVAVKLLTGIIGRSNRGRQFWLGLPLQAASSDVLTSTGLNLIAQVFTRHLLGYSANGVTYIPTIASRKHQYIRNVVEFFIDSVMDSQRRRLSGRGS